MGWHHGWNGGSPDMDCFLYGDGMGTHQSPGADPRTSGVARDRFRWDVVADRVRSPAASLSPAAGALELYGSERDVIDPRA